MLIHRGGQIAKSGTYWNITTGLRVDNAGEDSLPGDNRAVYVKMSSMLMLLVGPVVGLLYAMFLPFIGIAMTLALIGKKLAGGLAHATVKSTTFGWRPIEAYLDGRQRRKQDSRKAKNNGKM